MIFSSLLLIFSKFGFPHNGLPADFNYIYGTIILCWAQPPVPTAHLASVWLGGVPCRQRGGVAHLLFVLFGAGKEGGAQKVLWWHLCGFFSLPCPTSLVFYEDECRS